jgi:predicted Zn-dependent protease
MSQSVTTPHRESDLQHQVSHATQAMEQMNFSAALEELERIPPFARTPSIISAYALCLAEVKGSYKSATNLCHEAIKKEPKNPEHYYRQGRILLLAGRKKDAIWVMRMGLRHGRHKGIVDTLGSLGIRKPPPIIFLERSNPLNKYLGMLLTRLNLR